MSSTRLSRTPNYAMVLGRSPGVEICRGFITSNFLSPIAIFSPANHVMSLKRPDSLSGSTLCAERNLKEVRELKTSKQDSDYLMRAQVKRPPRKGISDGSG